MLLWYVTNLRFYLTKSLVWSVELKFFHKDYFFSVFFLFSQVGSMPQALTVYYCNFCGQQGNIVELLILFIFKTQGM